MEVEFDNESKDFDTKIHRFSTDIAELGKRSSGYNWRSGLRIGDQVTVVNKSRQWYVSTIIDLKESVQPDGRSFINAQIGYRIYTSRGQNLDQDGRSYIGSDNDEWIPLWSPRICRRSIYVQNHNHVDKARVLENTFIDDTSDPMIDHNIDPIYAVLRPKI